MSTSRDIVLSELGLHTLCFAVDEVNVLAEQYQGDVRKLSDRSVPTGNMLTAVAHTLQHFGATVYTGTGLRLYDIEQSISAYGKDIIVADPAFPPPNDLPYRCLHTAQTDRLQHSALWRGYTQCNAGYRVVHAHWTYAHCRIVHEGVGRSCSIVSREGDFSRKCRVSV